MQCKGEIRCKLATWFCQLQAGHKGPHEPPFISWPHLQEIAEYIEDLAHKLESREGSDA